LRAAFDAMTEDPEFLAEASLLRLEINPVTGSEVESLLAEAYATPPEIVEQTRQSIR
jgi:hypothetical protein